MHRKSVLLLLTCALVCLGLDTCPLLGNGDVTPAPDGVYYWPWSCGLRTSQNRILGIGEPDFHRRWVDCFWVTAG